MPRMVVFGYRCSVGSDDFSVLSIIEGFISTAWLGWFAHGCYRFGLVPAECFLQRSRSTVYRLLIGPAVVGLGLSVWQLRTSLLGTVVNDHPRRRMPYIVVSKFANDIITICALILNTVSLGSPTLLCDLEAPAYDFLCTAVRRAWLMVGVAAISTFYWLAPGLIGESGFMKEERTILSRQSSSSVDPDWDFARSKRRNLTRNISVTSALATRWRMRFSSLGRLVGIENHSVLSNLATQFIRLFKEDANLVPTDVLACLLILEHDQCTRIPRVPRSHVTGRPPWMNVSQAARYVRFAAGAYGWPMYALRGPSAFAALLSDVLKNGRVLHGSSVPEYIVDDNTYQSNTEVIRRVTGLTDSDLIYVSFHNKLFELPFFIALDHSFKSVVVSIRGTLSLEDIMVDLLGYESDPLPQVDNLTAGGTAHDGMLAAAEYLYSRLVEGAEDDPNFKLLDRAWKKLEDMIGKSSAACYNLMVTGQSLGAGVAAILAILLRQRKVFPDVRCFAYSPPGGLLSKDIAEFTSSFVCSVVLGDDIVSRMGMFSTFDFKVRLLTILQQCDRPKHEIFGGWLMNKMYKALGSSADTKPLLVQTCAGGDSAQYETDYCSLKYKLELEAIISDTVMERDRNTQMFLPGTILYIQEIISPNSRGLSAGERTYVEHYCRREEELFSEVLISRNIISHHVPWAVLDALDYLAAAELQLEPR